MLWTPPPSGTVLPTAPLGSVTKHLRFVFDLSGAKLLEIHQDMLWARRRADVLFTMSYSFSSINRT